MGWRLTGMHNLLSSLEIAHRYHFHSHVLCRIPPEHTFFGTPDRQGSELANRLLFLFFIFFSLTERTTGKKNTTNTTH